MPPLYPPYLCSSETQSLSVLPEDLGTYDRVAVLMENATVPDSLRVALTTALTSMQSNPNGWNTVLQPTVTAESVALVTNSTIRISLGAVSTYATALPETLTLVVPPALVASQQPLTATFGVDGEAESALLLPDAGHVTINGSFVGRATRADIRSEETHVIGLTLGGGASWDPAVGHDGEASAALLAGLASEQSEVLGWNNVLLGGATPLGFEHISRIDDATVVVAVPQAAAYSVAAPETLRFSIPAEALVSRRSISAAEPLTLAVNETNGAPALLGTLTHSSSLREDAVQRSALELQVALSDDVWVTTFTDDVVAALRASVYSVSNGSRGWDAVAQPALSADNFTRLNDSTLAITLGGVEEFDVRDAEPERIRVEVPAVAVASRVPRIVEPLLRVDPVACTLALGGTLARPTDDDGVDFAWRRAQGARETAVRGSNGTSLVIALRGCTWRTGTSQFEADDAATLIGGLVATTDEPTGFNAVLRAALSHEHVAVLNASAAGVYVPPLGGYDITAPEIIGVTVNASLIAFGASPANHVEFEIVAAPGTAAITVESSRLGPLRAADAADEAALQSRPNAIVVALSNDSWAPTVGDDCGQGLHESAHCARSLRAGYCSEGVRVFTSSTF